MMRLNKYLTNIPRFINLPSVYKTVNEEDIYYIINIDHICAISNAGPENTHIATASGGTYEVDMPIDDVAKIVEAAHYRYNYKPFDHIYGPH